MLHVLNSHHVSMFSSKKGAKALILLGFMILALASYRAVSQYKFLDHAVLTQGEVVGSQLSDYKNSDAIKMPVIKYFDLPAILISLLYSIPFLLKPANPNSALINGELLLFDKMISLTSLSNRENSALSTIKS